MSLTINTVQIPRAPKVSNDRKCLECCWYSCNCGLISSNTRFSFLPSAGIYTDLPKPKDPNDSSVSLLETRVSAEGCVRSHSIVLASYPPRVAVDLAALRNSFMMHLQCLLLLERVVDIILLRKEVTLDLGILQQLEVSLCDLSVSPLSWIYQASLRGQVLPKQTQFSPQVCYHASASGVFGCPYLSDVRTSPGG